jgi:hypothetical protein
MSKASYLKSENINRLKDFLNSGSLMISAKKFRLGTPAYRESVVNTAKSLYIELFDGTNRFVGNIDHTRDIYANRELILGLIERLNAGNKASRERKIGEMSKSEFKTFLDECLNEYFRRK